MCASSDAEEESGLLAESLPTVMASEMERPVDMLGVNREKTG